MADTKTFLCFIALLIVLPIFGRSIHQKNTANYDRIVENSIKHILPMGMNISLYNDLVLSYWTPERMASAKPMDLLMVDKSSKFQAADYSPRTMKDERTIIRAAVAGVPSKSLKAASSVVGKLYGRMGASNYVCSGSVIISLNGDAVLTAGHCVYDTSSQSWASNIIFVPAYDTGSSPYGRWVWRTAAAMAGWTQYQNFNYDTAILLFATSNEGEHIQDVTGSLGMTRNREQRAQTDAYGYPVNIHRGEELASCDDQAGPANIPQLPDFEGMRLPCNMTGGSSGGPWTQETNYQTSVNSFGIIGEDDIMYGPYFGDAIWNLWNQYQDDQ